VVPVSWADEELFGTVVLAAKLGRARAIVEGFGARYEQDWDDPSAALRYALAMIAVLQAAGDDAEKHAGYSEVIQALSDLLDGSPDHWLGRYLRVRLRTMAPRSYSHYQNFIAHERARAVADVAELIDRQSRSAWLPWFACPYLLAARLAWDATDRDPDRAGALVAAAAARPGEPVPFRSLGAIMCEAFVWYHDQPDPPERAAVGQLMRRLFPDQPSVLAALDRDRAR